MLLAALVWGVAGHSNALFSQSLSPYESRQTHFIWEKLGVHLKASTAIRFAVSLSKHRTHNKPFALLYLTGQSRYKVTYSRQASIP